MGKFARSFSTFSIWAIAAFVLIVIGLATLHWTTINSTSATNSYFGNGFGTGQTTHMGVRYWWTEINGHNQDSHTYSRDCNAHPLLCQYHTAGSWAIGWGVAALALIAIACVWTWCYACMPNMYGNAGKMASAMGSFLMFLAAACILVGALTYWSHVPTVGGSTFQNLAWSFILYCVGGGLALVGSFWLCFMPAVSSYVSGPVMTAPVTQQAMITQVPAPTTAIVQPVAIVQPASFVTTTTQQSYVAQPAPTAIVVQ